MKKVILSVIVITIMLGVGCVYAESNTNALPSLSNEIKGALPGVFGSETFAAAVPEGSAGFGDLPGGVDIGVGVNTNRDITFAALQAGAGNILPPISPTLPGEPPVNPAGIAPTQPPYIGPVLDPDPAGIAPPPIQHISGRIRNE